MNARPARLTSLLAGLTPAQFLLEHWQKKPLLVRQALPGFRGFLTPKDLCALAAKKGVASRTVTRSGGDEGEKKNPAARFRVKQGPLKNLDPKTAPKNWTLLVQGIESLHDDGWPLLQLFDFIPSSRVDDLMVSWAKEGGGVGPHTDLYDVFLLQGSGRRRWRIEEGGDLAVVGSGDEGGESGVRVLRNFQPQNEWVLEPGDLLYLPPGVAHEGTALDDDCMTWSVGFTQPTHAQLAGNFLAFLDMQDPPDGILEDKDLAEQQHPGELADASVDRVARVLAETLGLSPGSSFDRERVAGFVGRLCTGRPDVDYEAPTKPLSLAALSARLGQPGRLKLSNKTRLLYRAARLFVNGAEIDLDEAGIDAAGRAVFQQLANERSVALPLGDASSDVVVDVIADLYAAGFVVVA